MKKLALISTVLAAIISVFAVLKTRLPAGATGDSKTSFDTSRKVPHSGWATTDRDGVVSVTYFNLFREGPTTVTRLQPNSVAQLPRGSYLHSNLANNGPPDLAYNWFFTSRNLAVKWLGKVIQLLEVG
jgi:hypothetical protein